MSHDSLVRGSVYGLRRKCGKPTCACATGGALHTCMAITWTSSGRKRLRPLAHDDIVGNYEGTLTVDGPGRLAEFFYRSATGNWKLTAQDGWTPDAGTLNSWALHLVCY